MTCRKLADRNGCKGQGEREANGLLWRPLIGSRRKKKRMKMSHNFYLLSHSVCSNKMPNRCPNTQPNSGMLLAPIVFHPYQVR